MNKDYLQNPVEAELISVFIHGWYSKNKDIPGMKGSLNKWMCLQGL